MGEFETADLLREIINRSEIIVGSYTDEDCPIRERAEAIIALAEDLLYSI